MSNAPLSDDELPAASDQLPEEEPSWLERCSPASGSARSQTCAR